MNGGKPGGCRVLRTQVRDHMKRVATMPVGQRDREESFGVERTEAIG